MDIDDIQNYWDPGNEPTTDNGYTTKRFKSINGGDHEILPLQDPEVVETVSNIYMANVICQRNVLAMKVGEDLSPDDVRKMAAKGGWGARVCAVVDGYKIINIKISDGAELAAEAIMTCKPGWSLIGIGTGRHDHYLYLARECDESEVRELEQKRGKKAKHRIPKDEGRHGDRNCHGGGGRNNDGGQPRGDGQSKEGYEGPFEGPPPEGEQHGNGGRHGGKANSGGECGGKGSGEHRASHAEPLSIGDAYRTVNAGHWQRSKGPWPFAGIAVASSARSREDDARGGHGARTRPRRVRHGGIR